MKYIDRVLYIVVKLLLGIASILFGILFAVLGGWGIYLGLIFGIIGFSIVLFTYFDARDYYEKKEKDGEEQK